MTHAIMHLYSTSFITHQLLKKKSQQVTTDFGYVLLKNDAQIGGAKRDRTADLLRARQALSQLSYSPIKQGILQRSRNSLRPSNRGGRLRDGTCR